MTHRRPRPEPALAAHRPIFRLKIKGKPGSDGIRALRAVLKILLRKHGFACLDAREIRSRR
jgi:hypothetical protein